MNTRELEVVSAIGKLGSLARAARLLGISTAAVSKRLSALERRLGVRLFDRTTRNLGATAAGQELISHAKRVLADLEDLDTRFLASSTGINGHFRVLSTLGFGREVVAPILSEFATDHANVTVSLVLTQGFSEEQKDFDLAVALGPQKTSKSFETSLIVSNRRILVASAAYLDKFGTPTCPEELSGHRCLVMTEAGADPSTWPLMSGHATKSVRVTPVMSSNDGAVVVDWAKAGHGIALRSEWTVGELVKHGHLVRVLPDYWVPADVLLVLPRSRYVLERVRLLAGFLTDRVRAQFAGGCGI